MSDQENQENQDKRISVNSDIVQCMIGNGIELRGDLSFSGGLHVDGRIIGNLQGSPHGSRLTLSREGTIEGNINTGDAEINGNIKGDVHASGTVILHPQSRVNGNVYYGRIEIRRGACINGKLIANNPKSGKSSLLSKLSLSVRKSA